MLFARLERMVEDRRFDTHRLSLGILVDGAILDQVVDPCEGEVQHEGEHQDERHQRRLRVVSNPTPA